MLFSQKKQEELSAEGDIVLKVKDVSKFYQIYSKPKDRLKQSIFPKLQNILGIQKKEYFKIFWALKKISFDIKKGETVGIIGPNGSGKSTLLQIITGTLSPSTGNVSIKGRVASLLELGSGFNPEFTGRENILMNATVLGLSGEEINNKFEQIVNFADIGDFIDQPIKTYSSGMALRLAFAVQAQVEPDILIIDEALSVGDAKFQAKCFERLRQLKNNGTSILLVSHSTEQIVTHCSKAILINKGIHIETGNPKEVVNLYLDILFGKQIKKISKKKEPDKNLSNKKISTNNIFDNLSSEEDIFHKKKCYNPYEYRWGDGNAKIIDFHLINGIESYPSQIIAGQQINLSFSAKFFKNIIRPIFGITIKTKEGITVYGTNSELLNCEVSKKDISSGSLIRVNSSFLWTLAPGDYFISLGIASRNGDEIIPHDRRYDSIHLQVGPNLEMFGLVDLASNINISELKK